MLVSSLPFDNVPVIQQSDSVGYVLQQMQHYHVQHLPVAENGKFVGLVTEEALLHEEEAAKIEDLAEPLINASVNVNDHIFKAVSFAAASHVSIVPVTDNADNLEGVIEAGSLLSDMARFMQLDDGGALIVLEIEPLQYSLSEITKIVESNDAQITQLNTSRDKDTGRMRVTIRVNKIEVSDIVATFQRYEYEVVYYFGEELYANELKSNYENLINYLNI